MATTDSPKASQPRRRLAAGLVAATGAFAFLSGAERLMALASGYEPAAAAAACAVALLLALFVLLTSRARHAAANALFSEDSSKAGAGAVAACGFGAAVGAGAFALVAALTPGLFGGATSARSEGGATVMRSLGRRIAYPQTARARADALVACGEARSLARVLLLGGGRPELVRELLGRGAGEIELVDPDGALDETLAAHLNEEDRAACSSPRVRRRAADPLAFLEAHRGPPYDLIVVSPPEPDSILAGRWYSLELHRAAAARLAPLGVEMLAAPKGLGSRPEMPLGRVFAAMQEAYSEKAVAVLPGRPVRIVAARNPRALTADPAEAARRCSERLLPGGGSAPDASPDEFKGLLNRNGVEEATKAVDALWAVPETLRGPRLFLEQRSGVGSATGGGWRHLRWMLAAPIWACLPVLLAAMFGGMVAARRTSTPERPGRFALGGAAFLTGLASTAAVLVLMLVHQALRGRLAAELPALFAAAAAGAGLGGAAAVRLAARAARAPRMALTAVGFLHLLCLLGCVALVGHAVDVERAAGTLLVLAMVAIGLLGGLELGLIVVLWPNAQDLAPSRGGPLGPVAIAALAGAALGAAFVASGLAPAYEPGPALLILLGAKLVELAWLAAGAGGRTPSQG